MNKDPVEAVVEAWRDEFTKKGGRYGNSTYLIGNIEEHESFIRLYAAQLIKVGQERAVDYIDANISRSEKETEGMFLDAWNKVLEAARNLSL